MEVGEGGKFYKPRSTIVFQVALVVSNLPANSGDAREARSPAEENGNPLQYSCLENPMDGGPGRLQSMGSQRVRHD